MTNSPAVRPGIYELHRDGGAVAERTHESGGLGKFVTFKRGWEKDSSLCGWELIFSTCTLCRITAQFSPREALHRRLGS